VDCLKLAQSYSLARITLIHMEPLLLRRAMKPWADRPVGLALSSAAKHQAGDTPI
jgi:hypothetical protein